MCDTALSATTAEFLIMKMLHCQQYLIVNINESSLTMTTTVEEEVSIRWKFSEHTQCLDIQYEEVLWYCHRRPGKARPILSSFWSIIHDTHWGSIVVTFVYNKCQWHPLCWSTPSFVHTCTVHIYIRRVERESLYSSLRRGDYCHHPKVFTHSRVTLYSSKYSTAPPGVECIRTLTAV